MPISDDFKELLPPKVARDKRPRQYLFTFNPETSEVHLEADNATHPAHFPLHGEMAEHVTHPDRIDGYAVRIKNGWRIFADDLSDIDGYVKEKVKDALQGKHPLPSLPNLRYHGDPSAVPEAQHDFHVEPSDSLQ